MSLLAAIHQIDAGLPWLLAGIVLGVIIASRKVFGDGGSWR